MTPHALGKRLRDLEQRVEELEVAREQEAAASEDGRLWATRVVDRGGGTITYAVEQGPPAADGAAASVEITAFHRLCGQIASLREELLTSHNERDDARGALRALEDEHRTLCEEYAASVDERAKLVAEIGDLQQERDVWRAEVAIVAQYVGMPCPFPDDVWEDFGGVHLPELWARLSALLRLREALTAMVERAAGELKDKRMRENLLADLASVVGGEP